MNNNIENIVWDLINDPDKKQEILKNASQKEKEEYLKRLKGVENIVCNQEPNLDKVWENIDSRIKIHKNNSFSIKIFMKYAASIIVICFISFLFWHIYNGLSDTNWQQLTNEQAVVNQSHIPSLVLDNGDIIKLEKSIIGEIDINESMQAYNDQNRLLTYKRNSDTIVKTEFNTIIVPRAADYSIKLSDGTTVVLNSESKLKFPIQFNSNKRIVYLEGEAYFKVKRNEKKPFIVKVRDMDVEVLGTIFNINAYEENEFIRTTLVEGKVQVEGKGKNVILTPNQQSLYNGKDLTREKVNVAEFVSWVDGKFYFDGMSLERIMIQIERWYDVNVFFIDQNLKNRIFKGVIKKELSLNETLSIIEGVVGNIKIRYKNRNIYIEKI